MVIDTGLHARGWSRDKAIAWFRSEVGLSPAETANEVDRYCSWPGQACGYKVGHSEIVRLREQARKALAGEFDLRSFNQALIDGGGADHLSQFQLLGVERVVFRAVAHERIELIGA